MTKTLEQELESTIRAIVVYNKKRGWGVTGIEGSDWNSFNWKPTFTKAWKAWFGSTIELSEQEEKSIKKIEQHGPFKKDVDGDEFSAHEWWPASNYLVNGWLRGGLL